MNIETIGIAILVAVLAIGVFVYLGEMIWDEIRKGMQ